MNAQERTGTHRENFRNAQERTGTHRNAQERKIAYIYYVYICMGLATAPYIIYVKYISPNTASRTRVRFSVLARKEGE